MNASIITMTCTYNYGATLQAYALQSYIESLGHNCDIIDHMGWNGHRTIRFNQINMDTLLKFPFKKKLELGYTNFEEFYRDKMHMTKRYSSIAELRESPPSSDVFITGSDQVWNPRDLRGEFYLDFAPKDAMRVSYAASIGVPSIPDDKKEIISEYLKNMDFISVREDCAYESIRELTEKRIQKSCDPVYLVPKEDWKKLERQPIQIDDEYILFYMIYKPEWMNEWIKTVKRITKKKIVFVGLNGLRPVECDYYVRNAGPREFLWLIDNASAVVSSSFHGIAFSILFGKKFVAMPDPPRPDRIRNLLQMFNLERRVLYENDVGSIFEEYDYHTIEDIIQREREKTRVYFKQVFGRKYAL